MELRKDKGRRRRELFTIVSAASLIAAIGLLAFGCRLAGIDIADLKIVHVVGILVGLFGGIFGLLLLCALLHGEHSVS